MLLDGLSKGYLKDVMKGLSGFYGSRSGTNRQMAQELKDHLFEAATNGGDLSYEQRLIKQVNRQCWGGCGDGSEEGSDEDDY